MILLPSNDILSNEVHNVFAYPESANGNTLSDTPLSLKY